MAETTILDLRDDVDAAELRRVMIPAKLPRAERYRTIFGRSVDLGRIQSALLQADGGVMVELTDLESEMMSLDPHLSAIMRKRVGGIQSLPWRIDPASGAGVDPDLAEEIADVVRQQLMAIPRFTERLVDLAWATFYNRAALEIHWVIQSGKIRWRPKSLEWVHPRRLAFGPERELRLISTFRRRGDFVEQGFALRDFPGKFITWQPRLFNEYPEREGLGPRTLYWAFFKRFSWRMRMALTELFGVPWRIVEVDKDATVSKEAMDDALEAAERLGQTTAARFGKGMKLNIPDLGEQRGELFAMNTSEVNDEMSKMVLGQPGTTESDANRASAIVGKGEQDEIKSSDASGVGGSIQRDLVNGIVVLNYGPEAISHCPSFVLDAVPPRDAAKEQARIKEVVMLGVPVAVTEIREVGGVRVPDDDEAFVVAQSPGVDAAGKPLPAVPVMVDPTEPVEPTVPPVDGLPETSDDELDAAGGLEDEGPDGQAARAEVDANALARHLGIPIESAREAWAACDRGDAVALNRIRGLGTDGLEYLTMCWLKPKPIIVTRERVDELAKSVGIDASEAREILVSCDRENMSRDLAYWRPHAETRHAILLDAIASSIEGNHGHELRIADEVIDSGQGQTISIKGAADHDHTIELSSDDMETLFSGESVNVLSTEGGRGEHTHNVEVTREGANVDKPGDVDGGIDEFGRRSGDVPGRPFLGEGRCGCGLTLEAVGPFGSPEDLVVSGAKRGGSVINGWVEQLVAAIERAGMAGGVRALEKASQELDVEAFADAVEQTALRSSMLGALDSDEEMDIGRNVPVERFEREGDPLLLRATPFTQRPFEAAIRFFTSRAVVTPDVFASMADQAKTRAFTVAGAASEDVVRVVQEELRASLTGGLDLRTFKLQLKERLELTGWLKAKAGAGSQTGRPWHVETIYRNGVIGSYGAGREEQMLQPEVLAARPFWQIRTVSDGRRRETHGAVHLKVFEVGGEFLSTSGRPPYGFNCRCRAVAISRKRAEAIGISDGGGFDLPDPGWTANVILT